MGGGILQIAAEGEQDKYLNKCPQITFFQAVYKRHTKFAIETTELDTTGRCNFGSKLNIPVPKLGDLLTWIVLKIKLPAWEQPNECDETVDGGNPKVSWVNNLGHALINKVELVINNVTIESVTGEWLDIWSSLSMPEEKLKAYHEMIGYHEVFDYNMTGEQELLVPIPFWFSHCISQSLPLVALPYSDITLNIHVNSLDKLSVSNVKTSRTNRLSQQGCEFTLSVLADYVYLNTDERVTMSQQDHMFLIEQVQMVSRESVASSCSTVYLDLPFRHCVKELVWVIKRPESLTGEQFNYDMIGEYLGESPMKNAKLMLNGQERVAQFDYSYYRFLQPFRYHSRIPKKPIFNYCFAIKPEDIQPTGTCNFSVVDTPQLILQLNNKDICDTNTCIAVRCYARNYNVLKITGGNAAVLFSY